VRPRHHGDSFIGDLERRGRGRPHHPTFRISTSLAPIVRVWHEDGPSSLYLEPVQRQCARPGCNAAATATFTFDTRELTVWLDTPDDDGARAGELCERHVRALTPPQGWYLDDRRGRRESEAQELEVLLDAHSPLLARAFRNAGAV
jgi:hypothetical protein